MNSAQFVLSLFKRITHEEKSKGRRHELKAVAAFKAPFDDVPEWFLNIENASQRLDRSGVDVIVRSDIGKLFVQIKSCEAKAQEFKEKQRLGKYRKNISVAVIKEHFEPAEVRQVIIQAALSEYRQILVETAKQCHTTFIPATASIEAA